MKSIEDYLICPNCGHEMYDGSTNEGFINEARFGIENLGSWYVDLCCPHCKTTKRAYIDFEYKIWSFEYE